MECTYDLVLKSANVFPINRVMDIGIKNGKITALEENLSLSSGINCLDLSGQTICPGFVDSHMHIDKALISDEDDTTNLEDACIRSSQQIKAMYEGWHREDMLSDIVDRSSRVVEMCIKNGTTAIKNHVYVSEDWKMIAVEAMEILKKKYDDKITIKSIVPYFEEFDTEFQDACERGLVDVVGGYPNMIPKVGFSTNYKKYIDKIFELAIKYGLPVDMHVDESDSDDVDIFEYVIHKTYDTHMEGRVTCGHVTGLSVKGIDEEYVADLLAWCAKARVRITTMTSCNMYLMDIGRRGPTRVKQMLDCGIDVSVASDNIRDPFRPFGNGDLLDEVLLTAQVHKLFTNTELYYLAKMITFYPAENMLMDDYGVLPGCNADLVVLNAPNIQEAILSQVDKTYVIKRGKIIAKSGEIV